MKLNNWYGGQERTVEVCTDTAVWYHTELPPVEIRWVLIRDPHGEFEPQALLSTQLEHTPRQMLEGFVRHWTMEVTLEEAGPIWALRRSGSGMIWPLNVPPPHCSGCMHW